MSRRFLSRDNEVPRRVQETSAARASAGSQRVDVGIAVDTEGRLIVPLLRNVGERDAPDLRAGLNQPSVRRILPLSLTFAHRVVTRGEAARFHAALKLDLERPAIKTPSSRTSL